MKCGVVMHSQVVKFGRMDAGFHLLNQRYADQAAALSVTMTEEAALALLSNEGVVPTSVLQLLAPLTRGSGQTPTRAQLLSAAKEYPFLALAVIKAEGTVALGARQQELLAEANKLAAVQQSLQSAGPSIKGVSEIPATLRGTLDKSNFVAKVVYFDGDTLAIPPETSPTAYVADCWVIELTDWTGPEMIDQLVNEGNVPVPRRVQDLGAPVGYLASLPDHTENYGVGWRG